MHNSSAFCRSIPATGGLNPRLRTSLSVKLDAAPLRRWTVDLPPHKCLPVNGSREALFAFAQTVIDPATQPRRAGTVQPPMVVSPNPFYQIYEGAALLARAPQPYLRAFSDPARNFARRPGTPCPTAVWANVPSCCLCARPATPPAP